VLGADSEVYVLNCADDILIYSRTYDEHLQHLDSVFYKLTTAGFTINLDNTTFCKREVNL
jgi:hypothetical protein